MTENHCKDCCCARSWEALGIKSYTGRSIPEEIQALRAENRELRRFLDDAKTYAESIIINSDLLAERDASVSGSPESACLHSVQRRHNPDGSIDCCGCGEELTPPSADDGRETQSDD